MDWNCRGPIPGRFRFPIFLFLILAGIGLWYWVVGPALAPASLTEPERLTRALALFESYQREFPEAPVIEPDQAMELHARGRALMIDAREERERAVSVIPGAAPAAVLEEPGFDPSAKTVVIYCTIGYRSGRLVQDLARQGVHAYNLKAGIIGWAFAGGRLIDANGAQTRRVHVYGRDWNLLPEGFEPVW